MKQEYADTAGKNTLSTNTQKLLSAQSLAQCCYIPDTINLIKVKKIEHIGRADVYNMEVETHHNFSVNGGLIVHNSIDGVRYGMNDECINFRDEQKKAGRKRDPFLDREPKVDPYRGDSPDNSYINF